MNTISPSELEVLNVQVKQKLEAFFQNAKGAKSVYINNNSFWAEDGVGEFLFWYMKEDVVTYFKEKYEGEIFTTVAKEILTQSGLKFESVPLLDTGNARIANVSFYIFAKTEQELGSKLGAISKETISSSVSKALSRQFETPDGSAIPSESSVTGEPLLPRLASR